MNDEKSASCKVLSPMHSDKMRGVCMYGSRSNRVSGQRLFRSKNSKRSSCSRTTLMLMPSRVVQLALAHGSLFHILGIHCWGHVRWSTSPGSQGQWWYFFHLRKSGRCVWGNHKYGQRRFPCNLSARYAIRLSPFRREALHMVGIPPGCRWTRTSSSFLGSSGSMCRRKPWSKLFQVSIGHRINRVR